MTALLLNTVAWLLAAAMLVLTIRRAIILVAALSSPRPERSIQELPSVTLLVPARNEEDGVGETLDALAALDYPPARLFTVLVNDGSNDSTGPRFERWATARARTLVLNLEPSRGKIGALNAGLAAAPASALIVVCDADLRPRRDWLRRLANAFDDQAVGAAAPLLSPENAALSPVARYAAVESWVHQLVTSAGKDRLDLNPATNGASAYRTVALEPLGWFGAGQTEDDVRATVGLTRSGWRTRFVPTAIVCYTVVHRWADYWHQHIRWAGNLSAASAAPRTTAPGRARLTLELESWIVASGYSDRLIFVAVLALVVHGSLPVWLPAVYVAAIASQVTLALIKARTGRRFVLFLFWTVMFHVIDIMASATAAATRLARRPRT